MEMWEYKAFYVADVKTGDDMVDALREAGENGWELVSVVPRIDTTPLPSGLGSIPVVYTPNTYFVAMKRRKP
jgi:Domain of unknown function (DUF4177)